MELAGLILGVIPIAAQLFQSTLSLYSSYTDSQDVGGVSTKFSTLLRIQRRRYENWGEYTGLDKGILSPQFKASAAIVDIELILDILAHIAAALMEAGKLEKKYKINEIGSGDQHLDRNTLSSIAAPISARQARHAKLAQELKSRLSLASSLKFAVFDKPKFEALIADLDSFNDGLEKLTHHHQQSLQTKLLIQMLDTQSSPSLAHIATATVTHYPVISETAERKATFLDLQDRQKAQIRRKILNPLDDDPELRLDYSHMVIKKEKHPSGREFGVYKGSPVMIEWKVLSEEIPENQSLCRIRDLVKFLSISSPSAGQSPAHLLPALGYFRIPGATSRVALVYITTSHPYNTLISLITDPAYEYFTLGTRFRLALSLCESLLYLHLTGWLHKTLHSANILISDPSSTPAHMCPHIVGFTAARLDGAAETSEKLSADAKLDIYQHPEYQESSKDDVRYRQEYDIYSLGIVLLEIGMWTPVEVAGGYSARRYDGKRFRQKLLNKGPVESLGFSMGTGYKKAVQWCLNGVFEEGWGNLKEKERADIFWEKVVVEIQSGGVIREMN